MDEAQVTEAAGRFATRTPPVFERVEGERRHRLERMAGVCRIFGSLGFSEGLLGHVTVRDPEYPDRLWANPLGISFNRIRVSDIVQVDHDGNLLQGTLPVNPVGLLLHSAVHRARPDVEAVCHAHSTFGSAWSAFGAPVAPITQDTCVFFEDQAIIREPRAVLDRAAADEWAAQLGHRRNAIQVGHGHFTTGRTVDEAAWWFIGLDKACHVQLLARAAGGDHEVWPADDARGIRNALGSAEFGWLSFQALWDEICDSDPDLFD
jgi:ribulose-5-phosphate 4-epimerase/fuculose-1-phosphate aldolase